MGGEGPTVGPARTLVLRVRSVGGAALPSHRPKGDGRCHGAPGRPSGADGDTDDASRHEAHRVHHTGEARDGHGSRQGAHAGRRWEAARGGRTEMAGGSSGSVVPRAGPLEDPAAWARRKEAVLLVPMATPRHRVPELSTVQLVDGDTRDESGVRSWSSTFRGVHDTSHLVRWLPAWLSWRKWPTSPSCLGPDRVSFAWR